MDRELLLAITAVDRSSIKTARLIQLYGTESDTGDDLEDRAIWKPRSAGLPLVASGSLSETRSFRFGQATLHVKLIWETQKFTVKWHVSGPLAGQIWLTVLKSEKLTVDSPIPPYFWVHLVLPRSSKQTLVLNTKQYGFDPTSDSWCVDLHITPP